MQEQFPISWTWLYSWNVTGGVESHNAMTIGNPNTRANWQLGLEIGTSINSESEKTTYADSELKIISARYDG